jgi:hypothetical protein
VYHADGSGGTSVVCQVKLFVSDQIDTKTGIQLVDTDRYETRFLRASDVGRIVVLADHPSRSPVFSKIKFVLFCTPDII